MKLNIPNLLTIARILIIPVFVLVYYLPVAWSHQVCTALFIIAAVTDWLDGYLARRLQQTSAFGAFLDPVADKLIVAAALVIIVDRNPTSYPGFLLAMAAVVIIGREITISALREWMAEVGARARVAVSHIGKIKTTAQMIAIVFLIYERPIAGLPVADIGLGLLYMAALLTLWSMMIYLKAAWPLLNRH